MRICIVEDNRMLRTNLSQLLHGEMDLEVVCSHGDAESALQHVDWTRVDFLLADIDLPGMSGVEMIGLVKLKHPPVNCLAYTIYEDRTTVFAAIKAGACGYLLKSATPRELVESIREIHQGGSPMTPRIARNVLLEIQAAAGTSGEAALLTTREAEVLREVDRGRSYKEIGDTLHISVNTVHTHIKKVYEKVQARTRDEALRKARNLGVL